MIVELGHFALLLTLVVAAVQAIVPLAGAQTGRVAWMDTARPAALAQVVLVALSFGALTYAYVSSDFSVLNVYQNSHTAKPMIYKISGVWGNHEGSLLLWVLILAVFGATVALGGRHLPLTLRARVLSVQAMIAVGFLTFSIFTSNPFERIDPAPPNGTDLNPLLQDPGLAFHPPLLYLGYVGLSIAFSFAVAALIEGRVDPAWARWVRPWTLAAWAFLTLGIALGSWWAYYELGWGGWWFWDPVENASFMPWLVATALLHSAIVAEKRGALKSWTILLAILAFSLSLIGTFLVRSGVLNSVHAFANDPGRGLFILALLVIAIGGSLTLYAWRAPSLEGGGLFRPVSREGALVLNNLLMTVAAGTVLLGTLYPLFVDLFGTAKVSVGPPYFNATFIPLMVPMVMAMAVAPMLAWKRADLAGVLGRMRVAFLVTLVVAGASWYLRQQGPVLAYLGMALGTWLLCGVLADLAERAKLFRMAPRASLARLAGLPRSVWGTSLAHAGVAVTIFGITASAAWQTELILKVRPGQSVDLAGYSFTFDGVRQAEGANYTAERGQFTVRRGERLVATLHPERRFYPVAAMPTTEAAIHTTGLADLYAVIGEADQQGEARLARLYHNPLVPWIWLGAVIMVIGGMVSLTDRRLRIGAPARSRAAIPPGTAPAGAGDD